MVQSAATGYSGTLTAPPAKIGNSVSVRSTRFRLPKPVRRPVSVVSYCWQVRDPVEHRRAQEASQALASTKAKTFDECRAAYIAAHKPAWSNLKHAKQWETSLTTYASAVLGHLPVAAIDTGLVLQVLEPIWSTKPETASRIRGRIEAVLAWAKARGLCDGENPATWRNHLDKLLPTIAKLRKGKVKHHAALPYQQMGAFMADLRSRPGIAARALEFTILTGTRTEESLRARWDEIDWTARTWAIPAERMKNRQPHTVPLSEPALAVLRSMQHVGGATAYVFPGRKPGKPVGILTLLEQVWGLNVNRQAAGLPIYTDPQQGNREVTPHGFRSSLRDWAAERTNFPREIAEKALAHTVGDETERAYQRGELLEKRGKLMEAWARYCASAPVEQGNVVPLAKRGA
jgi:integrase